MMAANSTFNARPEYSWHVANEEGGTSRLTGRSITTTRHGSVGTRPEVLFTATLRAKRCPGEEGLGTKEQPLPSKLYIKAIRGDRSYEAVRLSQSCWDELTEKEKLSRLEEERKCGWPNATLADVRQASTFNATLLPDDKMGDATKRNNKYCKVDFYVYVCAPDLDGGVVSASVDGFSSNSGRHMAEGTNDEVSIKWSS
mmetsp:Transcript_34550/g.58616  ORF Transcript_34550/g.58616 Transcript_34550/m.58616 type:complete len:199 (-) Transcript_34550:1580-2176(-)